MFCVSCLAINAYLFSLDWLGQLPKVLWVILDMSVLKVYLSLNLRHRTGTFHCSSVDQSRLLFM